MYNIKDIRRHMGFTQQQMSEAMMVSKQTIHNWESGKHTSKDLDEKLKKFINENKLGNIFTCSKIDKEYLEDKVIIGKNDILKIMIEAEIALISISKVIDRFKEYI